MSSINEHFHAESTYAHGLGLPDRGVAVRTETDQKMALLSKHFFASASVGPVAALPTWIPEGGAGGYTKEMLQRISREYRGRPEGVYRGSISSRPVTVLVGKERSFLLLTHTTRLGHGLLGKGADKCVKRAIDLETGEQVAVSVVRATLSSLPEHQPEMSMITTWEEKRELWIKELAMQTHAAVASSRVLPLLGSHLGTTKAYLLTPLVEADLIHYKVPTEAREKVGIQIVYDILQGLEALHKEKIVHHDFHGGNIFIKEGRGFVADLSQAERLTDANKLVDFIYLRDEVAPREGAYQPKQTLLDLTIPSHQWVRNALCHLAQGIHTAAEVLKDMKEAFPWLRED